MEFKYDERVKVVSGFYEGQTGCIRKRTSFFGFRVRYTIYANGATVTYLTFKPHELRSLDFPNKEFHKKLVKATEK